MKYKYKTMNPSCKHIWGDKIGHDNTQFCQKCGSWRKPIIRKTM